MVTADQNLQHQQNLTRFAIAVVVLAATTNSMVDYEPMAEYIADAVLSAPKGVATWVAA